MKIILLKIKKPSYDPFDFGLKLEDVLLLESGGFYSKLQQLHSVVRTYQPNIVHSVLTSSNFLCRILRIFSGGFRHIESLVNQPYSQERLRDRNLKLWKIRLLQLFDRLTQGWGVDAFHANSEAVAQHYCLEVGVLSTKITVIPRGRQANRFIKERYSIRTSVLAEFSLEEPCLLLINTGRQEHQKAHDVLLKSLINLPTSFNWYLLIAGREGSATNALNNLLEQYELRPRVRFLGHRTDVARLLAAADLFVFPSRFEGMPGALIEACAAGLPIVCTDLPCMTEVVTPGENARVFPSEDVVALARQLEELMQQPQQMEKMGVKSLVLFQSGFQLDSIHERMEALYIKTVTLSQ